MDLPLQEKFVQSKGAPVKIGGLSVVQMDRIPLARGRLIVEFVGSPAPDNGIALKAVGGSIALSDGSKAVLVHIWDDPGLPRRVEHEVETANQELRVWNIYRVRHRSGVVTEDSWTGNAGMVVESLGEGRRRYRCSNSSGAFDPNNLTVEVQWEPEAVPGETK